MTGLTPEYALIYFNDALKKLKNVKKNELWERFLQQLRLFLIHNFPHVVGL